MSNIGHNSGDITPFDQHKDNINDLYDECKQWLDGEPVETDGQSEAVGTLMDMMRKGKNAVEESRKEEKKPHLDAGKAIDAKYKEITAKADLALDAMRKALAEFMYVKRKRQEEAERLEREEAERLRKEAEAKAQTSSLEDAEEAKRLREEAFEVEKSAAYLAKKTVNVKNKTGKAISERVYYRFSLLDLDEALRYYYKTGHGEEAFKKCVEDLAAKDARSGIRSLPGFELIEERRVV